MLSLLLTGMLALAFDVQPVEAIGTIYIRADGSVDPDTAPISSVDNVTYAFTDNINESIVVERDNIVVDGAGYTVQGTGIGSGITLSERINVTIRNMEIKAFRIGIYFDNSSRNCISRNYITENNEGIYLYGSNSPPETESCYNSILGNNITENGGGILLEEAKFNNISGNNITANHGTPLRPGGIYIFLNSLGNIVSGNNIINNERYGIYFHYCTTSTPELFNVVCGNNIINNGAGIETYHGVGIFIFENNIKNNKVGLNLSPGLVTAYHNNFVNNTNQVSSGGSVNVWNDGYPSGGNYWNDYTGVDLYSGSYQNETGSDGIGDTPYVIDGTNQDNYPLMNPWTPIETSIRVKGKDYAVTIVSNATIDQIVATANTLHFKSSGPAGKKGYIDVIFPMVNTTEIKVFIDGVKLTPPPFPVINTNGTHYFIYFEFTLSTHNIGIQFAPIEYTLTIDSSPTGVTFTADDISHVTPWSATYDEDTSVSLVMPEIHSVGGPRYYWNQWDDGVISGSRTVTMNTNIVLTAYFTGPYYELTVTSSPITGITFTINGSPETTSYTQWLHEGSYTLIMPETHEGYVWFHWLEDGDTSRTKIITIPGTTWTGVYEEAPPPPAVGGEMILIDKSELTYPSSTLFPIVVLSIITVVSAAVSVVYVKRRKKQQN